MTEMKHLFWTSLLAICVACGGDDTDDVAASATAAGGMANTSAGAGGSGAGDSGASGGASTTGGMGGTGGDGPPTCDPGFEPVGGSCVDIDECALGLNNCAGDSCVNATGSFGCACAPGQLGEATSSGNGCLSITGLHLWLDGADPLGTYVPPADDEPVGAWADRSGFGRNAVQTSATQMPRYVANGLGGRGVIRFDGADAPDGDALDISNGSGVFDLSAASLFIVVARRFSGALPAAPGIFAVREGGANTRISIHVGALGTNFLSWNGSTLISPAPLPLVQDQFYVLDLDWSGNESMRIDGVQVSYTAHPWNAAETFRDVHIGWSGAPGEFLNGDIAEIVLYNRSLNGTERGEVLTYLQDKWSL